jgi:hypothetical protein
MALSAMACAGNIMSAATPLTVPLFSPSGTFRLFVIQYVVKRFQLFMD